VIQGKTGVLAGLLVLVLLAAPGCRSTRSLFGGDLTIQIATDDNVNQNSPVQMELLVVFDKQLLQQVQAMSAQQWFAQRVQIRRNYPGEDAYVSCYWEMVPGQPTCRNELSFGVGARDAVLFANYSSAGDHRWLRDPHQDLRIRIQESDLFVGNLNSDTEVPPCTTSCSTKNP
jgi:type VI secretion system protein